MTTSLKKGAVVAAVLAAVVMVSGACGDSNAGESATESAAESTTSSTTSTTAEPATTQSSTTRPPADDATKALAAAGTLQLADFGDGWAEHSAGAAWTATDESCAFRADGGPEDALLDGSVLGGPTVNLVDAPAYVSSRSYAFATEADAEAWAEISRSDDWAQCWLEFFQAFQDDNDAELTVELSTREPDSPDAEGLESYAYYTATNADGGVDLVQAMVVYRVGRVIVVQTTEMAYIDDDTARRLNDGTAAAVAAAFDRLKALQQ